jgi:hypothetical protein
MPPPVRRSRMPPERQNSGYPAIPRVGVPSSPAKDRKVWLSDSPLFQVDPSSLHRGHAEAHARAARPGDIRKPTVGPSWRISDPERPRRGVLRFSWRIRCPALGPSVAMAIPPRDHHHAIPLVHARTKGAQPPTPVDSRDKTLGMMRCYGETKAVDVIGNITKTICQRLLRERRPYLLTCQGAPGIRRKARGVRKCKPGAVRHVKMEVSAAKCSGGTQGNRNLVR